MFDVFGSALDGRGGLWYRVLLPMRPNGTKGYIRARDLRVFSTDYRIVVSQRRMTLKLFRGCRLVHTYPIGLGRENTPTPVGRFYVDSLLKPPAGSAYGRWAYGLSAYSEVITDWTGGGIVGIHGTDDPSSIGRRVSHGCIRMRNADIVRLARILPLGTPVLIRA